MKCTVKEAVPTFTPLTLSITLESREELAMLYLLFNHSGGLARDVERIAKIPPGAFHRFTDVFWAALKPHRAKYPYEGD